MNDFTRHLGAVTVALLALGFSGAAIYLFVTQRPVSALLAGLVGTTIGYLLPSPAQSIKKGN